MIGIVVTLIAFGLCFWLVQAYVLPKVPDPFKSLITILGVLALCFWILKVTGVIHGDVQLHG